MLPLIYPDNQNRAADITCIIFIFIYALGYSLGLGPSAWTYSSEIFPTSVRARGLNFAASTGSIGSIIVAQVWPVGIDQIGCRIYFFFMAVNVVCVPIILLFYPETKKRSLEDMDELFGRLAVHHDYADDGEQSHDELEPNVNKAIGSVPLSPRQSRHSISV
jgi:MFS family permease